MAGKRKSFRNQVRAMKRCGYSITKIAETVGITKAEVKEILKGV